MSTDIKNIIKVASVIIGTVIGAGFASGQEILQFFTVYYEKGFWGIILAGILFCVVAAAVLDYVYKCKLKSYSEFIIPLTGKYAGTLIESIVMLFLVSSFFIMMAGSGALFKEYFGLNTIIGAAIMSAACCIVFLFNFRGLIAINTVIAPILVGGIGLLGLYIIAVLNMPVFDGEGQNIIGSWFSSSVLYVGYNSIALVAILANLLPYLSTRKVVIGGAILGGGLLGLLALVIYFLTSLFYPYVLEFQIPILQVIEKLNLSVGDLYSFILFVAMFTSAVSSGFCFLHKLSGDEISKFNLYAVVLCFIAVPLSVVGFSNLVKVIYPVFGYIGFFQVIIIITAYLFRFRLR